MSRKLRLWVCPCCHRWRSRKKNDSYAPTCHVCGIDLRAGRVYPSYKKCRHERKGEKIKKLKRKYHSAPRDQDGLILRPSKETMKSWRELQKSKRIDSFVTRGNKFIESLYEDMIGSYQHGEESTGKERWRKEINDDGTITKCRGGLRTMPIVEAKYGNSFSLGTYYYNIRHSTKIFIQWEKDKIKLYNTFLHEVLHWLDHMIGCHDSHTPLFYKRLSWLENKFKVKYLKKCIKSGK